MSIGTIQLASDTSSADERLSVEFYDLKDDIEIDPINKVPRWPKGTTFVRIGTPGDPLNIVDRPMRESDKVRWPRHWLVSQMAKAGKMDAIGTDIAIWHNDAEGEISRNQVDELRILKFSTVEQIALASDSQLQRIGMGGIGLRERARSYLSRRNNTAAAAHIDSIEKENKALRSDLDTMQAQMNEMLKLMKAMSDSPAKKPPGRPKKVAEPETTGAAA